MYRKWWSTVGLGMHWSLLVIVLAHLSVTGAQAPAEYLPEISEAPLSGMSQMEGTSKTLTCKAFASPMPQYSWFHSGQLVSAQNSSALRFPNLTLDDAGEYRCLASNYLGAELSMAANVAVIARIPFQVWPIQNLPVEQGKYVVLKLPPLNTRGFEFEITWEENNVPMSDESLNYQITLDNKLVFLSADMDLNNKAYSAVAAYTPAIKIVSSPYYITVRSSNNPSVILPEFVVYPKDTNVNIDIDAKLELECVINARPITDLNILWYRKFNNGTKFNIEFTPSRYLFSQYRRRLVIRSITALDTGAYYCEGILRSVSGDTSTGPAGANVTVQVAPSLTTALTTRIFDRDFSQSLMLHCQATGVPSPELTWYFNGKSLSTNLTARHTHFPNGSLSVINLDLPDAGKYQCFARNPAGETYLAFTLRVNSAPPNIVKAPQNLTIVEQADARFFCEVTGAPTPDVVWKKVTSSGEVLVILGGRFQIHFQSNLLIVSVQKADAGVYKCYATNVKGEASASATLTIITKTQIIRPPQNQIKIISTIAIFECGILPDENTIPVWEWFFFKNGDMTKQQQITSSGRYQIQNDGTLSVYSVSAVDIGLYKCHVISAGGNDSRTAALNVIEIPSAPIITNVALNTNNNISVIVRWNKAFNGNSNLTKYIITFRQENPNSNNEGVPWDVYPDNIPPDVTQYIVSHLNPSRYYRFRISAVNTVGEGNASQPMPNPAIKMPTQPPSSPPRNFFCNQGETNDIHATWDPPEELTWNGDLKGYVLRYKVFNLPNNTMTEIRVEGPARRSYIIQYLVWYKQYAVTIAAYNEEGAGVFSNEFYIWTREGRPTDAPKNVVANSTNSTTISLQWDPPYTGEINGRNRGYTIEIRQSRELVRSLDVDSDSNNLEGRQEWYVYQLKKYTEYNVTIGCKTSAGVGPYSSLVSIRTLEDVPGRVQNLEFDNIRDQSLLVRWAQPAEVNGKLTGYNLEWQLKNMQETKKSVELPESETSYTVQYLVPVTNYTICANAKTSVGSGALVCADIKSGVPPELPQPPYNLGFSNIGARTVLLQFFPGFDGKTSITLWIVQAKTATMTDFQEIFTFPDPAAREIWVQNLKPYTKYKLRVIAKNIVGESGPSEPTREFETLQAAPGEPPGSVTVRALNATALRVSWTAIPSEEWNGVPSGYKIYYRMWSTEKEDAGVTSVQEASWKTISLEDGINLDSYILIRLQEWMDYQIRMISYNDIGSSPYSPVVTARTRESTPNASPSSMTATALSSTLIFLSWVPVPRLEQNGQILGYKVWYKPQDDIGATVIQDVEGKDKLNVTLTGLRKFVKYSIQILAYTRMGDGKLSPPVIQKTDEDVPGPPIIIYFPNVTYTSAVVVWSAPSEPNGFIMGYKVSYRKQEGNTGTEIQSELGPNVFDKSVEMLERETYYIFSVTAKTRLGWGQAASVLVLTMLNRDRPNQPGKPTVGSLQIFARNITIAWQPGTDNYSPIRNFTIQYKVQDGNWTKFPVMIPPSASSFTVTGLRPNSLYQFQVAASNDIGISNYSEPSAEVKTQSDKPDGAPQNLRVVAVTRTSIRATWESPSEDTWNGLLLNYIIQYRQVQQQDFQDDRVQFGTNELLISNLAISQTYEVQVLAFNGKGQGPPSTPATIYVGEAAPTASPSNIQGVNKSASSIEVTWQEPPPETQNGALSGYKVLFYKNTSSGDQQQRISSETRILLTGLDTFTIYMVSVQAYNLAGEGPRSSFIAARTSEGVPSVPGSLKFTNITMRQLTISFGPPSTPNGYILLYEMEYFPKDRQPFDPLPPKRILRDNETRVVVTGLEENKEYIFRVSANTSIGRGVVREANVSTGPQPGSPAAPSKPIIVQQDRSLLLQWTDGTSGASRTYGYFIQNKKDDGSPSEFVTIQQEITGLPKAIISLTDLNPNTGYYFRIIAINDNGISQPSVMSDIFVTPSFAMLQMARAFHTEWWFLVIIALTGIIVILVLISLLCLFTRRRNAKSEMKRSQTTTTVVAEPSEPEEGGFPNYEMRQSQRNIQPRNGSVKNIYARAPPRPSPASVAYSDEDDNMSVAKPPIPDDTSSSSSCTEKLSDTEPSDEESESDSEKVPASPPPPAFSTVYTNNDNTRQSSWRFPNPNAAYAYTDSEADSSHYAFSLNNGQLVVNNVAGARTPLTGFSSFV